MNGCGAGGSKYSLVLYDYYILVCVGLKYIISNYFCRNALGAQPRSRTGGSIYKRYCMLAILLVLGVVVLLLMMSRLGRYSTEDDPSFDPMQNPNIRVQPVNQRSM